MQSRLPRGAPARSQAAAYSLGGQTPVEMEELVHKAERDGIQAEGPQLVLDGDADQGGGEGRVHQPRSGGEVELSTQRDCSGITR